MMAEEYRNERTATSSSTASAGNLPFAAVKTLSVNELRTAVEVHLKQCGALNRLKTELRGMMLEGVLKETKMRRARAKQPRSSYNAVGANGSTTSKLPTSSITDNKQDDELENFEKMRSIFATQDAKSANEPNESTTDHLIATLPLPEHQTQKQSPEEEEQQVEETHFAFQKWCAHVADALVAHHLRITERQLTYSLFVNEAVVLPLTDCGVREEEDEVLRKMLLLPSTSSSLPSSHHGTSAKDADVTNLCENDNDNGKIYRQIRMRNASRYSVLQSLIECNLLHQRKISSSTSKTGMTCTNRTAGTQTEHGELATEVFAGDRHQQVANNYFSNCKNDNLSANKRNSYAPLTTLEARLAAVDIKHALEMSHIQRSRHLLDVASIRNNDGRECRENSDLYYYTPSATPLSFQLAVERRLQTYKQEMHAQLRKEYEMKRERFERERLEHAKQEAAENFAVRISNMTEAMEEQKRALEVKLANERQALTTVKESLEAERNQLLKSQRVMAEERMQHDEVNAFQLTKLRENNEKLLLMQVKCAKWEELASSRLVEVNQLKRKVESLSSHIERMYVEYAQESDAKNDEIARLQFKLRMLLSEHIDANGLHSIGGNRHDDYSTNKNKKQKSEEIVDKKIVDNHKISNTTNNEITSDNSEGKAKRNVENVNTLELLDNDMHVGKNEHDNKYSSNVSNTVKKNYEEHNIDHNTEEEEYREYSKNEHKEIKQNDHVSHDDALPSTSPAVNAIAHNDQPISEGDNITHQKNSSNNVENLQVYDQRTEVEQPTEEELYHKNETERAGTSKKLESKERESANSSYTSSESTTTTTITQSSRHNSGNITNKEEIHQNVPSSSNTTTSSTSTTSSRSSKEKNKNKGESVRAKEIAERNELEQINTQINDMVNTEEVNERRALSQEEQQMWNGIAWTHKSQLSLITEREKNMNTARERNDSEHNLYNDNTTNKDSASDDEVAAASPVSLFARMQRAEAAQERKILSTAHNVDDRVNHSDDTDEFSDDEADELLFAKKSSSSSSSF